MNKYQILMADSVTNDTLVWIKKDGLVFCKNIEELFNENNIAYNEQFTLDCFDNNGLTKKQIIGQDGKEYTNNLCEIYALSVNKHGITEFKKINTIMRHKINDVIYNVRTSMGEINVTKDHSLYTTGMKIIKPIDNPYSIILTNVLPNIELLNKIEIYKYINHKQLKIKNNRCYITKDISLPAEVYIGTKEYDAFITIVGAYLGDGTSSATDNKVSLHIDNNDVVWLQKLLAARTILTKKDSSVYVASKNKNGTTTYRIHFDSRLFYTLLTNLCGYNSKDKKLPEFFFNLPKKDRELIFNEYYFGDGTKYVDKKLSKKKQDDVLSFDTSSTELLSGFIFHLNHKLYRMNYRIKNNHNVYRYNKNLESKRYKTSRFANCIDTKVLSINKYQYNDFVYDLSVEDNKNFVTGFGVVAHNTDGIALGVSSKTGRTNKKQIVEKVKECEAKWQKELNFPEFELDIEEFEFVVEVGHKNYLYGTLESTEGIKTKGVLFKAQNKAKLGFKILKQVIFESIKDIGDWDIDNKKTMRAQLKNNIIENTNESVEKINMKEVDVDDLVMYENVNPVSSYKKDDSIQAVRTKAIEKLTNIKIIHSSKFPMLVCKDALSGITKISPKKKKAIHYMYPIDYVTNDMIDFDWYKENVRDYIFSAFGINKKTKTKTKEKVFDEHQKSIFDY